MTEGRVGQLGFPNRELMDCKGYSGGIWCLWDHNISSISVLERHHQFIHIQVFGVAGNSWMLTVVYASPSSVTRRTLWENLSRLALTCQMPWIVGGDFNGTLLFSERRSSATHPCSIDRDFLSWTDSLEMRDIGFVGPEFTWKRVRHEKLQKFCYKCGYVGHDFRSCACARLMSVHNPDESKYGAWTATTQARTWEEALVMVKEDWPEMNIMWKRLKEGGRMKKEDQTKEKVDIFSIEFNGQKSSVGSGLSEKLMKETEEINRKHNKEKMKGKFLEDITNTVGSIKVNKFGAGPSGSKSDKEEANVKKEAEYQVEEPPEKLMIQKL
ncbi:hypothetical protein K1719_036649 [Acacia pycnantha]|nr:hypothetical protein K1719_036649 [Acacia pycnantha]